MTTTAPLPPPALSDHLTGRLKVTLAVLLVAQFMLAVDFSILNVALPAIGDDLGFTLAGLQWVATAFALFAAGFTLLFGRVGDLIGRKRIFLGSLALLGVASLVGGLAPTPELLIAARVAQGLATAAATPAGLALLTTSFPEGPLRRKALGLNGALMSAGFTAGAVLGSRSASRWGRRSCPRSPPRPREGWSPRGRSCTGSPSPSRPTPSLSWWGC
ncbi:MFS transporter [Nonomuraea sp. PA05]|uniref:MFS transporter n=1 Tax=Nonomuraea sp. PA05 TaxID=2604466 RepID=UPI0021CC5C71|nr:MFS transporter [Nonomuraea sp. PA05]